MRIFSTIVTFNGMKWYKKCLESLQNSDVPTTIIVVDNASTDGTVSYIQQQFPSVHIIKNNKNIGFAKANNIGIKYAIDHGADEVFLLNQDAWVQPSTLTELVKSFEENKNVGIVSPIHMNGQNTKLDLGFARCMQYDFITDSYTRQLKKNYIVPYVNAAAWMLSRKCIETIGGFDTSLFVHYGEDNNYCQRLGYHGLSILINTHAIICHDREERMTKSDDHREQWKDVLLREETIEQWSNINENYDFKKLKNAYRRKLLKSFALFKYNNLKRNKEIIEMFETIENSREINRQIGLHWL